jgi:hypothetical protein
MPLKPCNRCGKDIGFRKEPDGRTVPLNPDGTVHRCKSSAATNGHTDTITGRLMAYNSGSATFLVKDGSQKTYAIVPSLQKEWQAVGFSRDPEVWLEFNLDKNKFVQGSKQVPKPAWAADLTAQPPITAGQASKPPQKPAELPKETSCTSPQAVPAEPTNPPLTAEEDTWMQEREEFCNLLTSTGREGIQDLLQYLVEKTDFFLAPSSTKYHDARDGGLLHHSLSTYHNLVALSRTFAGDYREDSLRIVGLLHDICKANFYKTSFRNVKHEERPIGDQWVKEPYIDIDDQFPLGHGEKSTILLLRHISLTDTEIMAIRWHMMAYDDIRCSYAGNLAITNACSKYPVIVLMHIADLSASFLEMRPPAGGA